MVGRHGVGPDDVDGHERGGCPRQDGRGEGSPLRPYGGGGVTGAPAVRRDRWWRDAQVASRIAWARSFFFMVVRPSMPSSLARLRS